MKIIFCLPGKTFSNNYFNSWNATVSVLRQNNIDFGYSMIYDPVVYYTRNRILGGNNNSGRHQKPWGGQITYDKMIWIDSDMVWSPDDVMKLIQYDLPIVAGTYLMSSGDAFPVVENLDYTHLVNSGTFQFMSKHAMASRTMPFVVSYTGFGFIAIKAGILETMEYPWFQPRWFSQGNFHDFCAEDVGFCWAAQELGHKIWVDPTIRLGHEKLLII
jgi:hypothetical protein